MRSERGAIDRRSVLRGLGALGLLGAASACSSPFAEVPLALATGGTQGVYFNLGNALADVWFDRLDLDARPQVLPTAGSVDNLARLAAGAADVVFSQVDTAADQLARSTPGDPRAPRALSRGHSRL